MATKVKIRKDLIEVPGGRYIEITGDVKGFVEGETVVAFRRDELCDFEISVAEEGKGAGKHVSDKHIIKNMHVLDAAIAQHMGKGKIIKVHPLPKRKHDK